MNVLLIVYIVFSIFDKMVNNVEIMVNKCAAFCVSMKPAMYCVFITEYSCCQKSGLTDFASSET